MTRPYELNSVNLIENASILCNVITDCMIKNELTLEALDNACQIVKELYRTDAIIRKAD